MSKVSQFQSQCQKIGITNQAGVTLLWKFLETQSPERLKNQAQEVSYALCQEVKKLGVVVKRTQTHELIALYLGINNRHILAAQKEVRAMSLKDEHTLLVSQIDTLIAKGDCNYSKVENGYAKRYLFDDKYTKDDKAIDVLMEKINKVNEQLRKQFVERIPVEKRKYYKICLIRRGRKNYTTLLTSETSKEQVLIKYLENTGIPEDMIICSENPIEEITREEYENFSLSLDF